MSKVLVTESYLSDIGDAIRNKNGGTTKYKPSEMAAAIKAITAGNVWDSLVHNGSTTDITDTDTGTFTGLNNITSFTSNCTKVGDYAFLVPKT